MEALLSFAVSIAREAGQVALRYFRAPGLEVGRKHDGSPVTRADRETEEHLRTRLRAHCPEDGVLGEEFGEVGGRSGRRWILDPIDGTKSFARGIPLFGTLVALEEEGRAVLGVVYLPALAEMVFAARGRGARWVTGIGVAEEERPARTSTVDRAAGALLCTTSVGGFVRSGRLALYEQLRAAFGLDRGLPDCFGHVLVATGRAEVMVDPVMAVWDCAALQPVLEEAGGTFTDLGGAPTHLGGSAVSTNGPLFPVVRALLA